MTLDRKIDFAIKLLRSIPQDGPIELSYSGGKDSDVILQLAKEAGIPYRAIYKDTTIDPPGTHGHVKEVGAEIVKPKRSFLRIIEAKGYPNRFRRFCCSELKEYKICDRTVLGIRRSESTRRTLRYKEPEVCRVFPGGEKERRYLPILEWTLEDVTRFIQDRGIKCAPVYYDEQGTFHPERRLGCMCCPLNNIHARQEEFKKYPRMLRLYARGGQKYLNEHPQSPSAKYFGGDVYKMLFFSVFFEKFKLKDDYEAVITGGMFPETAIDAKAYMEDYFKIDLTI